MSTSVLLNKQGLTIAERATLPAFGSPGATAMFPRSSMTQPKPALTSPKAILYASPSKPTRLAPLPISAVHVRPRREGGSDILAEHMQDDISVPQLKNWRPVSYHTHVAPRDRFQKATFFVPPEPVRLPTPLLRSSRSLPNLQNSTVMVSVAQRTPAPHRLETWRQYKAPEILQFSTSMLLPRQRWRTHVVRISCRYCPEQRPDVRIPETVFKDAHFTCQFAELYQSYPELQDTIRGIEASNPERSDRALLFAVLECHLSRYERNAPSVILVPMLVKVEPGYDTKPPVRSMSLAEFVVAMNISC